MSTKTIIIDADILVYKASEAVQELFEVTTSEDENHIYRTIGYGDKKKAIDVIEKKIGDILAKTKANEIVLALSDSEANFRKDILPTYKGQRKSVKPILYSFLRDYLHKNYKVYERPTLEGDDILGILATSDKIIKGFKAVWSLDKDLSTIPCTYFHEDAKGQITKRKVTEAEADWNFMYQTLLGDTTDGYKGCKNIGKAKATKILGAVGEYSLEEMWQKVVETYEANNMTAQECLVQARCARILRVDDYDFKNKEVKLWNL